MKQGAEIIKKQISSAHLLLRYLRQRRTAFLNVSRVTESKKPVKRKFHPRRAPANSKTYKQLSYHFPPLAEVVSIYRDPEVVIIDKFYAPNI